MEMTPNHYVIRVPRLAGYKTLVVNAVIAIWALIVAIWPELPSDLNPDMVGAWFDQGTGLVVLVVGVLNIALRLMASGPAWPFKRTGGQGGQGGQGGAGGVGGEPGGAGGQGGDGGTGGPGGAHYDKWQDDLARDIAAANAELDARYLLAKGSPRNPCGCLVDGDETCTRCAPIELVDEVHVESGPCVFPHCACHIRCEDRAQPDVVTKPSFTDTLTSPQGMRAMLAGFMLPWLFLSVVTLAACADTRHAATDIKPTAHLACADYDDCLRRYPGRL